MEGISLWTTIEICEFLKSVLLILLLLQAVQWLGEVATPVNVEEEAHQEMQRQAALLYDYLEFKFSSQSKFDFKFDI